MLKNTSETDLSEDGSELPEVKTDLNQGEENDVKRTRKGEKRIYPKKMKRDRKGEKRIYPKKV